MMTTSSVEDLLKRPDVGIVTYPTLYIVLWVKGIQQNNN